LYYSEKGGYPIYADMDIKTRFAHKDACYMDEINLQYVAATRAREALIVMSNLGGENVNTFFRQFNLSQCNRFDSMLECAEIEKNTPSYKEYVYKADTNIANEQTISPFICIKPSDSEKSGTAGKKEASENELDDIQAEETISVEGDDRPKGNIVGNVLHRSYELFVNRWKRDFTIDVDKAIKMCVSQALVENAEDISTEETDSFREFVEKTLKSFTDDEEISQLVKNADKIYTELEFSYMLDKTQAEELLSEIDTKGRFHDYNELWVNGTADLVLVAADGSVVIADYKSDNNSDHLKDFKDRLNKKYENQLKLYKYSIAKLLNVDLNKISTRIVN
jgi:ATP-dependent exoDNAse (exonuclease V) beta subunit